MVARENEAKSYSQKEGLIVSERYVFTRLIPDIYYVQCEVIVTVIQLSVPKTVVDACARCAVTVKIINCAHIKHFIPACLLSSLENIVYHSLNYTSDIIVEPSYMVLVSPLWYSLVVLSYFIVFIYDLVNVIIICHTLDNF